MLRTSGRRIMAGLALLLAVGVVVAIVLASGGTTPSSRAASGASKVSGAATVQRRNLVQTDTESGTLSYSRPQTVYNRRGGTVTWLPSVGQLIKPGKPLYEIDGKPVILLDGTEPAYRDLKSSDSAGPDILQLNRTLAELGYGSGEITVDDEWQAGTTLGIDQLQGAVGLAVTGKFTLGQIVFLPGQQRVTTVDGTLGATEARAAVSGSPSTEFVDLTTPVTSTTTMTTPAATTTTTPTTPTTTAPTTTTPATGKGGHGDSPKRSGGNVTQQELQALTALLRAEIAQLRAQHRSPSSGAPSNSGKSPSSSSGSPHSSSGTPKSSSGGGGGGSAVAILQTTSTQLVVTVDLDATLQSEATVGEHVTVEMPDGSTVNGTVTAVSPVAQSSSSGNGGNGNGGNGNGNGGNGNGGSGSGSTIPVTIALSGHHSGAGLDQAAVSVNFQQAKANHVLSVPVTALLATGGSSYGVQEAAAPHKLIPVQTGLFAAGYVQISGPGIYAGLQVTDSQG